MLAAIAAIAALAAAAASAEAIVEAHADAATQADAPLLVAHADGGWTITRAIGEDAAALDSAAGALLLADVEDLRFAGGPGEREIMREIEMEDRVGRAFEEAIDKAREPGTPQ